MIRLFQIAAAVAVASFLQPVVTNAFASVSTALTVLP